MRGKWMPVFGIAALHVFFIGTKAALPEENDSGKRQGSPNIRYFEPHGLIVVPGFGSAEIAAATPDGMTLVYANSLNGKVGAVDISDASNPVLLFEVAVPGEPTSVAVSPDGRFALAAVQTSVFTTGAPPVVTPGRLVAISLEDGSSPGFVPLGPGPDAVVAALSATDAIKTRSFDIDTSSGWCDIVAAHHRKFQCKLLLQPPCALQRQARGGRRRGSRYGRDAT